jgi:hypothetical protein
METDESASRKPNQESDQNTRPYSGFHKWMGWVLHVQRAGDARGELINSYNLFIMYRLQTDRSLPYTTSTKTWVPRKVEPLGHCWKLGATLS